MNKHIKTLIVCSIISFIGAIAFVLITYEGVSYSPGISETDMENMSYYDVSKMMADRAQKVTAYEFISNNINTIWVWQYILKLWLLLFVVSFSSIIVKTKWCNEQKII